MIEPFFYGERGALAFYHPSSDPASTRLMVLCPPLFDEYRRSYRWLSELANACAAQGVHVLRIDYSGTGEAQGELSDISDKEWIEDIHLAIEEGISLTGADDIILTGIRFGASLATQVNHQAISRYVFWDPVEQCSDYVTWLNDLEKKSRHLHHCFARQANQKPEEINYACFALNDDLLKSMQSIKTNMFHEKYNDRTFVFYSDVQAHKQSPYKNSWYSNCPYNWPAFHEGNLSLKPVLELIVNKVAER